MHVKTRNARQREFFEVCKNCRTLYSCCNATTPPVTYQRKQIINQFLKNQAISSENAFVEKDYVYPRLGYDKYCVFHDKQTRKCRIHPVKPETCVAGPITFDVNTETGMIEWFVKKNVICHLAGLVSSDKDSLTEHLINARREILRLVSSLDGKALKAILSKDEPETVKIGESHINEDILRKLR